MARLSLLLLRLFVLMLVVRGHFPSHGWDPGPTTPSAALLRHVLSLTSTQPHCTPPSARPSPWKPFRVPHTSTRTPTVSVAAPTPPPICRELRCLNWTVLGSVSSPFACSSDSLPTPWCIAVVMEGSLRSWYCSRDLPRCFVINSSHVAPCCLERGGGLPSGVYHWDLPVAGNGGELSLRNIGHLFAIRCGAAVIVDQSEDACLRNRSSLAFPFVAEDDPVISEIDTGWPLLN
eukprot:RCo047196